MTDIQRCPSVFGRDSLFYFWRYSIFFLLLALTFLYSPFALANEAPNLTITLQDGTQANQAMPNTLVHIKEVLPDESHKWRKKVTTDAQGQASVYLEGLGAGKTYVLYARNTFNNRYKTSIINATGHHVFQVGTPLLSVTLKDAVSQQVLPETQVTAWELLETGKRKSRGRVKTDAQGQVRFDIPELTTGNIQVQLSAKAYNNFEARSQVINTASTVDFKVGSTVVTVSDGTVENGDIRPNFKVDVRTILADGKTKWYGRATSDAQGIIRLDLPNIDQGTAYQLSAKSLHKNKTKYLTLTASGNYAFKVGTPLLHVTMKDAQTGNVLPNVKVTAYQIIAGQKDKWRARVTTDAQGKAVFDLPELSNGDQVYMKAKVYNKFTMSSPAITTAGAADVLVGDTVISVVDGTNQQALVDHKVIIYEVLADGSNKWFAQAWTDGAGQLKLNLPGLGTTAAGSRQFIFKAKNPFNNKDKISEVVSKVGAHTFTVGTTLLSVTLKDAHSSAAIANTDVRAWLLQPDGKYKHRAKVKTNAQGVAEFDIPELASGAEIQLRAKVYNNLESRSAAVTSLGAVDFPVGKTLIEVRDGTDGNNAVIPDHKINIYTYHPDKNKWYGRAVTDAQGMLRVDLPGLGEGTGYVLNAKSLFNNRYKSSETLTTADAQTFTVGSRVFTATLLNGISGSAVAEKRVTLYELQSDGKRKWLASDATDTEGKASVDVDVVGDASKQFVLGVKPYNAGSVYSAPFMGGTFAQNLSVGTVPVTLWDKAANQALTGQKIIAYEKAPDGQLTWRKQGTTDDNGLVYFDLEGLRDGATHVFRVHNPFGDKKKFFSPMIMATGPVQFAIAQGEDSDLDTEVPELAIAAPLGEQVGSTGFTLQGSATDDQEIAQITLVLTDTSQGSTEHTASYDTESGLWTFDIPASRLTSAESLQVAVTARDTANNEASVSTSYSVVEDAQAPVITVNAPQQNEAVKSTGFLMNGTVTDDTGVNTLQARVEDSALGEIVNRELTVSTSGSWSLAINNGQLATGSNVTVTLVADDVAQHSTTETIALSVVADNHEAQHLLNRITFGATPELLATIEQNGAATFLNTQLNPAGIDDSNFEAMIAGSDPFTVDELRVYQLQHMVYSRRQLREVMAWFWENHFNTDINKMGNQLDYELVEHRAFRTHALGRFRDLLDVSARSPAMLYYLDNVESNNEDSNENYARELLELHTCGVDACYTQADVEALAEVFTGWQVQNDAFFFNADQHNPEDKVFQGVTIQGRSGASGVNEGDEVLDRLATHAATANYVCSKLVTVFVNDAPVNSLVARCADTFLQQASSADQMAQVLRTILSSPEFFNTANFNAKIKTPLEFAIAPLRSLQAQGNLSDLSDDVRDLGMNLFAYPVPTGWSETGDDWVSSALLQERVRYANQFARANDSSLMIDPLSYFSSRNLETAEGIVTYLLDLLGGDVWTDLERQTALDILNNGSTFDINAANAEGLLREMIGTVLSYPAYNYQ